MPGHTKSKKYKKLKRLLLPVTEARGITKEQKKAEDLELERMYYRTRKGL